MAERSNAKHLFNLVAITLLVSSTIFVGGLLLMEFAEVHVFHYFGEQITEQYFQNSGIALIFGAFLSVLPPALLVRNQPKRYTEHAGIGLLLFCLLMVQGLQLLTAYLSIPMEAVVNSLGFSTEQAAELASGGASTISMLLYSIVVAPICEEMIYRGAVLRSLAPCGRGFAITVSALFFGLMHQNIIQFPFAFLAGLLFGYIADRYSIRASIIVHALTNLTSELSSIALAKSDFFWSVQAAYMLAGLAALWLWLFFRGRQVRAYCNEIRVEQPLWRWFFSSFFVLVYIALMLVMTASSVTPVA